ncbi:NO-inducible flavohemoprotein [Rhodopila sp.]|jgi:nitric oxide dioxygenase|uniref:NO-inducible flavohemoprotein n=1 Tax=Rhodopila sp. TaxID=2480087 RepID=UPI002C700437|nr:NO-inducible flavohemoprotein [Rhodopila sp.]HVZ09691.1 NO-inducible flavohemoprotein [Rhodopila sp.]
MTARLTSETIALVKATVPALEQHGLAITRRMYERMFQDPAIRDLFNQSHHQDAAQPKALAAAVLAYARNIDNLGVLGGAVERIAQKHVALNILPEHYPHVATSLLGAIADVLGEAASPEVLGAWGDAYWALADILIGREAAIYRDLATRPGGWNGWRDFVVESTEEESSIIRSLILVPADGGAVLRHKPGQYLGFALDLPGLGTVRRNYSISCAPNGRAYRITVKREAEPNVPPGAASNWLHDKAVPGTVLRVAAPAGDFFLDAPAGAAIDAGHPVDAGKPVALVSGGVGLTPMVSMLETIAAEQPDRPVWWVHGARNGRVHAMREHVRTLGRRIATFHATTFYDTPLPEDRQGEDYEARGMIPVDMLVQATPSDTMFYLCGPKPFLRHQVRGLVASGVSTARLRYEFFGPADDILNDDGAKLAAD